MHREKKRILVVDDEVGFTRLLKLNLEKTGDYVVRVVNQSGEALESAEQFHPDLILLDVMMPGHDGGELAGNFRTHLRLKSIPIVFFTAAVRKQEVIAHDGTVGGLAFLAKPAALKEVIACLEHHLNPQGGVPPAVPPPAR